MIIGVISVRRVKNDPRALSRAFWSTCYAHLLTYSIGLFSPCVFFWILLLEFRR